ncbi:multiubiquitin domain-containing protein [Niabella aurantiaca]|uniref:multiubiquitin domain-containing protein n=1 Tax=Niabella aurantiaca TaxID=379900 RepID=UPI00036EB8F3|nr:multiubiquitin domain-containing protein [Niabella aurantiaca]
MLKEQNNLPKGGHQGRLPLTLIIEGREIEWTKQYISGKEARRLVGLSEDADLYLAIADPWDDEPVGLETEVDLAREGIESFYVRRPLALTIEGKQYQWKKQYITGVDIRKLANLEAEDEILLMLQRPYEDEIVKDNTQVNLAREGIEHFRVRKKDHDISVTIRINDRPFSVKRGPVKVSELKKLAGVSLADELSELIKGKLIPLADDATVLIKGGEEFFSCKREGTSS